MEFLITLAAPIGRACFFGAMVLTDAYAPNLARRPGRLAREHTAARWVSITTMTTIAQKLKAKEIIIVVVIVALFFVVASGAGLRNDPIAMLEAYAPRNCVFCAEVCSYKPKV